MTDSPPHLKKDTTAIMENNKLNAKDKSGFFSKLSRTLYIGNLDENVNDATLYKYFGEFGDIISINIKKESYVSDGSLKIYALIKYFDANSVVLAMHKMNDVDMEGCHVHLGFGKSDPSKCVWITGIKQSEDNNFLLTFLADCGPIITCVFDEINKRAIIYFKEIVNAETAINKMKNGFLNGLYFHGDYASCECQVKFAEFYNKQNHKNCVSINLDTIYSQNPSIYNAKQKSARSHYAKAVNSWIASKESTSQIPCIWVNGIGDSVTNEYLESLFSQFGPIKKCLTDRFNKYALLCFQEELHAQSAVTAMNGCYIEGESVHVHLAYIRCRACEVSNANNDNFTIQQQDNTGQSSHCSERHVDPYYKCTINDETCPVNIRDPRNISIYVNNSQDISQHKYLNISYINILKDSSHTNSNDSSITIIFNEYPSVSLKSLTQYADSDVLSLPMPEFAKNIFKELTTTPLRYSLSSNVGVHQAYDFNVHHDRIINCDFGNTDERNKKQDQINNHPLKCIESATAQQSLFFEETKRSQDVLNIHTPEQFIQPQSSLKFQDQQLSSSLSTLSSSGSSKYGLDLSASVNQSQYCHPKDTKLIKISQNNKTPLIDSQILPLEPNLLINQKCASSGMISDINGLVLKKQNICTISNNMQTSDAINTDFINPIPGDKDRYNEFFETVYRTQDECTKNLATTSKWLTNTPTYNSVEKLDHSWISVTSEGEKEDQKKLQSKQINKKKSLDVFVAENSIENAVCPIFADVEKSPDIYEDTMDNTTYKTNIANILLSLNNNIQNKIVSNETKDKIEKTNRNESANSISNNGNNKSIYYNHIKINNYKEKKIQNISSISSMECKNNNIKYNKIQGEVEKTNDNEYNTKHLNIKKNMKLKKPILHFNRHEKENKHCKLKTRLGSKSIKSQGSKYSLFEFDMFKTKQTINKETEIMINSETKNIEKNKDYKFGKGLTTIEEEKQNFDIHKNYKGSREDNKYKNDSDIHKKYSHFNFNIKDDNKSKKYTTNVDRNIPSNCCSTGNSLKRIIGNLSENHNDSKRRKINNKAYGWKNGFSIIEILSNASKAQIYDKVKV